MKTLPKVSALAALCCTLAMGSGQAFAASSASVTMGPLSILLVDLNPLDGIAPSITFAESEWWYGTSYTYVSANDNGTGAYDSASGYSDTVWGSSSSNASIPGTWAAASVSGSGSPNGTTISASGSTQGTQGTQSTSNFAAYNAQAIAPGYYYYGGTFTLSDNTAVIFSANISGDVAVTGTFDPSSTYGWEHAYVQGDLSTSGTGASGTGSQNASDSFALYITSEYLADESALWGYVYGPSSATGTQSLAAAFVNVSGGDLSGYLHANVYAYGYSYVAAVPEPETYAMLLAGLGIIGATARRRQKAA